LCSKVIMSSSQNSRVKNLGSNCWLDSTLLDIRFLHPFIQFVIKMIVYTSFFHNLFSLFSKWFFHLGAPFRASLINISWRKFLGSGILIKLRSKSAFLSFLSSFLFLLSKDYFQIQLWNYTSWPRSFSFFLISHNLLLVSNESSLQIHISSLIIIKSEITRWSCQFFQHQKIEFCAFQF